jgi:cupin 2 domain-containing protein
MNTGNILRHLPASLPNELFETLARGQDMRIERIVSQGHCSPPGFWYDQDEDEWVLLISGAATLRFEEGDRTLHLTAGSYANIRAHEKHRVEWTSEEGNTVWLAVFYRAAQT